VKDEIKISVVVPVYNVGKYLERCINSITSQTLVDFEIIIIDDGSTDQSKEIYSRLADKDDRIRTYRIENSGSGFARNLGLQKAVGKYVYFCDPDDWIESNLLMDNYNIAERDNSDVVFFGVNNYFYKKKSPNFIYYGSRKIKNNNKSFRDKFSELYYSGLTSCVWNKLYKIEYLTHNKCVFSHYSQGQDLSFNVKVYKNLQNVSYNEKTYYNYVKYTNNTAITKYNKDKSIIRENLYKEFSQLFLYWDSTNQEYTQILFDYLFSKVSDELRNVYHFDSPLSNREKRNQCRSILKNTEIRKVLINNKNCKKLSIGKNLYKKMIKYKLVFLIKQESILRQIIRRHFKSIVMTRKSIKVPTNSNLTLKKQ
jgi:glycosyltransferase involved in cell wall biosynthesis